LRCKTFPLPLLVFIALAFLLQIRLHAGEWHYKETSVCSDCHTQHNSQGGQPMRYDGAAGASPTPSLLRNASALSLCVYCHDGSNPAAPDVIAPVAYEAAGGFFSNTGGVATNRSHNLGMAAPILPPGGSIPFALTCVTCHDPHGNSNYRNLWFRTGGGGNTQDVSVVVDQAVTANGSNPGQVYIPSNLFYKSGMSQWCNDCHTNFHGKTTSEEGLASPWFRHPQDQALFGAADADYAYWSGTVADRVPVRTPTDNVVPSGDDQVFCLSCHKAHGAANRAGTIFADGSTLTSTCQQCHNE